MTRIGTATGLLVSLAAAGIAAAGPLDPDRVSADARWLLHVDVEALTGSTVGRFVLEHGEMLDIDLDELDDLKDELGFDPREDLLSLTLYGTGDDPEDDAVAVAVTTGAADEALRRLRDLEDVRVRKTEIGGEEAYSIRGDHDRLYVWLRDGRRSGERLVVLGRKRGAVARALDVMKGRSPSLSRDGGGLLDERPQRGSIAFVAAGDLAQLGRFEPASRILRMCDGVALDVGERGEQVFAAATLQADTPEVAGDIRDIVHGLLALGRLVATEQPDMEPLLELVRSLDVATDDRRVTVRLSHDVEEVIEQLRGAARDDEDAHDDDDDDDDE